MKNYGSIARKQGKTNHLRQFQGEQNVGEISLLMEVVSHLIAMFVELIFRKKANEKLSLD